MLGHLTPLRQTQSSPPAPFSAPSVRPALRGTPVGPRLRGGTNTWLRLVVPFRVLAPAPFHLPLTGHATQAHRSRRYVSTGQGGKNIALQGGHGTEAHFSTVSRRGPQGGYPNIHYLKMIPMTR